MAKGPLYRCSFHEIFSTDAGQLWDRLKSFAKAHLNRLHLEYAITAVFPWCNNYDHWPGLSSCTFLDWNSAPFRHLQWEKKVSLSPNWLEELPKAEVEKEQPEFCIRSHENGQHCNVTNWSKIVKPAFLLTFFISMRKSPAFGYWLFIVIQNFQIKLLNLS